MAVYAFQNETVRGLIDSELDKLDRSKLRDDDETTAAFVRATNKYGGVGGEGRAEGDERKKCEEEKRGRRGRGRRGREREEGIGGDRRG